MNENETLIKKIDKKIQLEDKKKMKKMRVNSKSVFGLKKIITKKGKNK